MKTDKRLKEHFLNETVLNYLHIFDVDPFFQATN